MKEPSVAALLGGLGETVRHRLAPLAADPHLASELRALASILRILAQEHAALGPADEAARADAAACLASLGGPAGPDPRAGLAARVRELAAAGAALPAAVAAFRRADLARGYAGLLAPGGEWAPGDAPAPHPAVRDRSGALIDALRRGLGWPADVPVEVIRNIEGYAAETTTLRPRSGLRGAVVRVQWPGLPLSRMLAPVALQAAVLRALAATGTVRAPRVLMLLDEPVLGAPALVTEHVAGTVPANWTREGRRFTALLAQREGWRGWAEQLAAIQRVDWRRLPVAGLRGQGERRVWQMERIGRLEALYRSAMLRPDPLIEEVLAYLRSQFRPWGDEVLVHGDFRPGNLIYAGDRIAAVIDWDGVTVGDHHEDLGVALMGVHRDQDGKALGLADDQVLLGAYAAASGRNISGAGLLYAQMLAAFRRCVGFHLIARGWMEGGGDVRMARLWLALRNDREELGRLLDRA